MMIIMFTSSIPISIHSYIEGKVQFIRYALSSSSSADVFASTTISPFIVRPSSFLTSKNPPHFIHRQPTLLSHTLPPSLLLGNPKTF